MQLTHLLENAGIDPATVLVLRHRPFEPELRRVLPWFAAEQPDTFNAYQQTQQNPRVEAAFLRARYIASFIGHQSRKAVFVGLYERGSSRPLTGDDFWSIPAYQTMRNFGIKGFTGERETVLWFDLMPTSFHNDWKGRLVVSWPGLERSWWRWASQNEFPIETIHEQSVLDADMPAWDEIILSREELNLLPASWRMALSEWRGIYHILDETDGKGYVGSAYGKDNLLGRWLTYATTGHGGNKELRARDSKRFRFSILQRVSPDMEASDVIRLEATWKARLHTREFGLNEN